MGPIAGFLVGTELKMYVSAGEEETIVLEGVSAEQAYEETSKKIRVASPRECGFCFIFCSLDVARANGY